MNLRDLLPPALRGTPVREVRIHSPESIAAAAKQPGTLANRVLKGLFTGQPLVVPQEQQDFVDYLARQLTKQLLNSEKRGLFRLHNQTVTGLAERWSKQPITLLDSPDVREGHAIIIRPKPGETQDLLHTIADARREIPWTVVINPSQWDVSVMALEMHGCEVINKDAEYTPHQ